MSLQLSRNTSTSVCYPVIIHSNVADDCHRSEDKYIDVNPVTIHSDVADDCHSSENKYIDVNPVIIHSDVADDCRRSEDRCKSSNYSQQCSR